MTTENTTRSKFWVDFSVRTGIGKAILDEAGINSSHNFLSNLIWSTPIIGSAVYEIVKPYRKNLREEGSIFPSMARGGCYDLETQIIVSAAGSVKDGVVGGIKGAFGFFAGYYGTRLVCSAIRSVL